MSINIWIRRNVLKHSYTAFRFCLTCLHIVERTHFPPPSPLRRKKTTSLAKLLKTYTPLFLPRASGTSQFVMHIRLLYIIIIISFICVHSLVALLHGSVKHNISNSTAKTQVLHKSEFVLTKDTSPYWASYGVSIVRIFEKIYSVATAPALRWLP